MYDRSLEIDPLQLMKYSQILFEDTENQFTLKMLVTTKNGWN